MHQNIRTTVIGGLVFLIPLVFIFILLEQAYGYAMKIAKPITRFIPLDTVAGVVAANVVAVTLIVVVSYAAGKVAQSSVMGARVRALDGFFARAIPSYQPTKKGFVDTLQQRSFEDDWKVVLVGGGQEQRWLGFEVERRENGMVVVFQPLTPNTSTGFVWVVEPERVYALDMNPRDLSDMLKKHGIGVTAAL